MQMFFKPRSKGPTNHQKKKRTYFYYSCWKKFPYSTYEDAKYRADQLLENGIYVRPYKCDFKERWGEHFHVGRERMPYRHEPARFFLAWEMELGSRVTGCIKVENWGGQKKRRNHIAQRYNSRFRKIARQV